MKHSDRLRRLSIGCLAIAGLALTFEISSHGASEFHGIIIVMIVLGTALEQIRLEFRDLRAELLKQADAR